MRRVLVANRGEIAARVARTVQQMGMQACTLYSEADAHSPHALESDEAYALEGNSPLETYLRQDRIFELARQHRIDAIHPGYGFLSENAGFARRCRDEGIVFIGPSPEVIAAMGDKLAAKHTMREAGVPTVPSFDAPADAAMADFLREAEKIGFPLLVKAAAGGGGKGMRRVDSLEDLEEAIGMARREAGKAFADDRVFLEKYISNPRHVEIQIFGDTLGNVVHLGERECSIQRRYQKIVEESPCPIMTPELRARMGEAALKAATALGYSNAGTVEFLVDDDGHFYFLEVNTRLQVEHPVTEMVYGQDLVRAQLLVAQGQPLPFRQVELVPRGWAMETRLYAEDPERNFMPSTGRLAVYRPPSGPGIRVDSGVAEGGQVSIYYDPMLAKLITWGSHREEARQRMVWALSRFPVLGVRHNLEFLASVLSHPDFVAGRTHTHFLSQHAIAAGDGAVPPEALMLAATHRSGPPPASRRRIGAAALSLGESRFVEVGVKYHFLDDQGAEQVLEFDPASLERVGPGVVRIGTRNYSYAVLPGKDGLEVWLDGRTYQVQPAGGKKRGGHGHGPGGNQVEATMPGTILDVKVEKGASVQKGDPLLLMESMKMEMTLEAPRDGVVAEILCRPGERVELGAVLVRFE